MNVYNIRHEMTVKESRNQKQEKSKVVRHIDRAKDWYILSLVKFVLWKRGKAWGPWI